jgi:hypothetical protein
MPLDGRCDTLPEPLQRGQVLEAEVIVVGVACVVMPVFYTLFDFLQALFHLFFISPYSTREESCIR